MRPFITNVYTESLGLFWGLISLMFFVECMRASASQAGRSEARGFALLALVTLTFGELTRMGSMFTIPAFVLWVSVAFASTLSGRVKLFAICSGLVGLTVAVQALLSALYGNPGAVSGGNFAYTFCGLAAGGNWTSCPQIYAAEFGRLATEREQGAFLYAKGLAAISHDPLPMLQRMYENVNELIVELPAFMILSYLRGRLLPWWPVIFLVPGFCWALWYRGTWREMLFWVLFFLSMVASAAIIFADDGWRVFYATWPYVALFASLGAASPGALRFPAPPFKMISVRHGAVLIIILVALIMIAPAATRAFFAADLKPLAAAKGLPVSLETVLIGRTLTGFAVFPDDAPLPRAIPAMHLSEFRRLTDIVGIERDFGKFVDIAATHIPFAFIEAARVSMPGDEQLFIAPVQMLSEPEPTLWNVTFGQELRGPVIRDITLYRPLP
jgi:hypothetical protein